MRSIFRHFDKLNDHKLNNHQIMGESKNYLLHHFQDEHYFEGVKVMYSSDVSSLHLALGSNELGKMEFTKKWMVIELVEISKR